MSERTKRLSRRSFLLTVGAAGAATAAAIVSNRGAQAPLESAGKRATGGYRASEHVQHYYRTAKT